MPVILQRGETMESQHKVSTKFGGGMLHVTNRALIIEIRKKGIVFYRHHGQMAGIASSGLRKIRVQWPEGRELYSFEFKAWGAGGIVKAIRERHDYAGNYSLDGVTRVIFTEERRRRIRKRREEWAAERLRDAEKGGERPAEMWRWLLLDVHGAACNRSVRIPDRVEDHMCWNDSWLGDDGYAHTFNDYWLGGGYPKAPVRGGGIDPETGAYRIPLRHIRFFHGYPYVRGDAFEYPAFGQGFLVPTMLESMLDAEIIERRYRPRDRLAMGMGLGTKDPIAILGYLNDPNEASDVGGDGFLHTGTEVRILGRYGLVPGAGGRPGLGALPEKVTSECV